MNVKATLLLLLSFALSQSSFAQTQGETRDQAQGDLSALRTDIRALQAEQQQIITRLDELKQFLQAGGRPANTAAQPIPAPPSVLNVQGEKFRGDSTARVAIVEYSDFECPYCGEYERETSPSVFENYIKTGKVKLFYRDLPLPMHPHAMSAARAARCSAEQNKYWEMHDSLFARQTALSDPALLDRAQTLGLDRDKFSECLSSKKYADDLEKEVGEAQRLGIDGTPTFFIGTIDANNNVVNIAKRIGGAAPYQVFKSALDALVQRPPDESVSIH